MRLVGLVITLSMVSTCAFAQVVTLRPPIPVPAGDANAALVQEDCDSPAYKDAFLAAMQQITKLPQSDFTGVKVLVFDAGRFAQHSDHITCSYVMIGKSLPDSWFLAKFYYVVGRRPLSIQTVRVAAYPGGFESYGGPSTQ